MKENPLTKLKALGQSIWLDFISRDLITSGKLRQYIEEDGLSGLISNHANFDKAIAESHEYDDDIRKLVEAGKDTKAIYESIMIHDIQLAADEFRKQYHETDCQEGYVSLKLNSYLAHDIQGTIEEARRLWTAVNRPNIYIKIPATVEGRAAMEQLISEGINVNATLLFWLQDYNHVISAYLSGLELRIAQGKPIDYVSSVASFYLGNIDELFAAKLEKLICGGGEKADLAKKLKGKVAISIAKTAYQIYKEFIDSGRFERLVMHGANPQRLVWTNFSDMNYVDSLIGQGVITAMPLETLHDYREQGRPFASIEDDAEEASWVTHQLSTLGSNIEIINQQLECKGIEQYDQAYDKLLSTIEKNLVRLR